MTGREGAKVSRCRGVVRWQGTITSKDVMVVLKAKGVAVGRAADRTTESRVRKCSSINQ